MRIRSRGQRSSRDTSEASGASTDCFQPIRTSLLRPHRILSGRFGCCPASLAQESLHTKLAAASLSPRPV